VFVGVKVIVGVFVMVGVFVIVGVFEGVEVYSEVAVGVGVSVGVLVAVGVGVFEGVEVEPSQPVAGEVTTTSISTRIVRELDDSIVIGSSGTNGTIGTKVVDTDTSNLSPLDGRTPR
jgi:hypothetical protein